LGKRKVTFKVQNHRKKKGEDVNLVNLVSEKLSLVNSYDIGRIE